MCSAPWNDGNRGRDGLLGDVLHNDCRFNEKGAEMAVKKKQKIKLKNLSGVF
jgi:hypothetical protein